MVTTFLSILTTVEYDRFSSEDARRIENFGLASNAFFTAVTFTSERDDAGLPLLAASHKERVELELLDDPAYGL